MESNSQLANQDSGEFRQDLIERAGKLYSRGISLSLIAASFGINNRRMKVILEAAGFSRSADPDNVVLPRKRGKVQGRATATILDWMAHLPRSQSSYVSAAVSEFYERHFQKPAQDVPSD